MWTLLYADDISEVCDTAEKLREAVIVMDATILRWCLTISTKKTKVTGACGWHGCCISKCKASHCAALSNTWAAYSPKTAHWMLR